MPNFDQTGPDGQGPATGKKQGSCINQKQNSPGNNFGNKGRCCPKKRNRGRFFQQNKETISSDKQGKILKNRLAEIRKAKNLTFK